MLSKTIMILPVIVRSVGITFGRVIIHFNTTDLSAICGCKVNQTAHSCSSKKLVADPRVLGEGVQNVTISCYDSMGYVAIEHIKLSLHMHLNGVEAVDETIVSNSQ